jgi:hypothetical protein
VCTAAPTRKSFWRAGARVVKAHERVCRDDAVVSYLVSPSEPIPVPKLMPSGGVGTPFALRRLRHGRFNGSGCRRRSRPFHFDRESWLHRRVDSLEAVVNDGHGPSRAVPVPLFVPT